MIGAAAHQGTAPALDVIQPFQLELDAVRGRLVRLGPVLDEVLARHAYPAVVEQLVAELMTNAVLLASLLKYQGIFTLQAKGNGPVSLVVTDVTTDGTVRAYASFDPDRLPTGPSSARTLLGDGYLAFTVDQGEDTERYQGIVELTGDDVHDWLAHYFAQSEQLGTAIKVAARRYQGGWRGGGILLQRLPEDDPLRVALAAADLEDAWVRAKLLLGTTAEVELLDRSLAPNDLLYRLFHEEEVRVFKPTTVHRGCRCSEARVRRVLGSLPPDEIHLLKQDGQVTVTCEFCSTEYRFDDAELASLYSSD